MGIFFCRYSIPASESDLSIGSAVMPKTLRKYLKNILRNVIYRTINFSETQNNSLSFFDDTISTSSKISSHQQIVQKNILKDPAVPANEHKSAVKVLPTPSVQPRSEPIAAVRVLPPVEIPKKVEPPKKGLFDNSDDESDIFQDKNAKNFFRGAQPERKTVNLFDDQPPIDDEYSKSNAAKMKKSVNLFLESDEEDDYGPASRNNKKVNLFDNDQRADAEVEIFKSDSIDKTVLSDEGFVKSAVSAKMGRKIISLFDDDPPVDDFDEIFKPKSGKIVDNIKPKVSNESKSVNLFGDYDDGDIFGSKNINSVKIVKVEDKMEVLKPSVPVIAVQNQPKKIVDLFSDVVEDDLFTKSHSKVLEKTDIGQSSSKVEVKDVSKVEGEGANNYGVDADEVVSFI